MHNKNKMKVSELKEIIRKTIKDVVTEDMSADAAAQAAKKIAIDKEIIAAATLIQILNII